MSYKKKSDRSRKIGFSADEAPEIRRERGEEEGGARSRNVARVQVPDFRDGGAEKRNGTGNEV